MAPGPGGFSRAWRAAGGGPGDQHFEFNFGGGGAAGGAASIRATFSPICSAARRRRAAAAARRGDDVVATADRAARNRGQGGSARVVLPSGRTLEVKIPAGVEDGKQIRLRGQGQPGPRGRRARRRAGDRENRAASVFSVEGRDLRLDLPVTLYEAALGAKVEAPTLGGKVELTMPPGSNGGRVLRLRGKGLPAADGKPAGDLYVSLKIMLPEEPDAEFEALMTKWRDKKPYDPRKGF